jgi:hypothetical protein
MKLGRGSLQGLVRFGLAAGVVMAAGTIRSSGAEEPKRELTVVDTPPPGCKELGEVEGKHFRAMSSPSPEMAEKNAREDAAKLGATHLKVTFQGRSGQYEEVYTAIAYRCPIAAPPTQGK